MITTHRNLSYVYNRIRQIVSRRVHRFCPRVAWTILPRLSSLIKKDAVGLEIGAGNSTVWYARRCARLLSIEHSKLWHDKVLLWLKSEYLDSKVTLFLAPLEGKNDRSPYLDTLYQIPDNSLDFVVIDGKYRDFVALGCLSKLKTGGFLLIDDSHRYLPRREPSSAPFARRESEGYASALWEKFAMTTTNWQRLWYSDGVQDTVIYIKPDYWEKS